MNTTLTQEITFGRDGDADAYQAYGWSLPEDGFTWTDGRTAGLILPVPAAPQGFFIELFFWVNGGADGNGSQTLIVSANGHAIGQVLTYGRMRLAFRVPAMPSTARRIIVNFELPDATPPSHGRDSRHLGLAFVSVRLMTIVGAASDTRLRICNIPPANDTLSAIQLSERITGLTVGEIAGQFESLGVNCEPGFFQRRCGIEPLGLLRFSGVVLHSLVTSIDSGFRGLGDKAMIDPVPDEADLKDWIIYERRHMLRYHTWVQINEATAEDMRLREAKRLPFLRRKFLEDLENGEKIFVHQHDRVMPDEEIWPLFLAIRRHGPGSLLCIGPADDGHQPGHVEEIAPGLMRAYFSHFSCALACKELSVPEWLAACTNAWLLTSLRTSSLKAGATKLPAMDTTAAPQAIPPTRQVVPDHRPTARLEHPSEGICVSPLATVCEIAEQ